MHGADQRLIELGRQQVRLHLGKLIAELFDASANVFVAGKPDRRTKCSGAAAVLDTGEAASRLGRLLDDLSVGVLEDLDKSLQFLMALVEAGHAELVEVRATVEAFFFANTSAHFPPVATKIVERRNHGMKDR